MKKKMNIGVMGTSLSRGEMKKIMAGSGAKTNCILCPHGQYCETFVWPNPIYPGPGCSWGQCPDC